MPSLYVADVKDAQILSFLLENRHRFDITFYCSSENTQRDREENVLPISTMFPPQIRPVLTPSKVPFSLHAKSNPSNSDHVNGVEVAAEEEEIEYDFPPDIAGTKLLRVRGCPNQRRCDQRLVETLVESTPLLGDERALFEQFQKNGYVYFKQLLDRDLILQAKSTVLGNLGKMGHISDEGKALSKEGWTVETRNGTIITGKDDFAKNLCQGRSNFVKF